ncbi:MAG: thiamine pyrophosphate-binding protein [Rhodospirillaceae bacterium]|nr:thiamine pyrophosphate-binding protein [Rhodospirillaceae bacterium]|tara:strand:+ start:6265 stop:6843 length:579 start_codon:yes stop_codon:yes gene_type:complete
MGTINRRELLSQLLPNPEDFLIVSGLAGASKDTSELTDDGSNLFTMAGTMGASVPMALGVALSAPSEHVIAVAGDGELMMGIGSLPTVASMMPENLTIICVDNGMHAETGGQLGHTSRRTNLAVMAEGAGIPSIKTIENPDQIADAAKFIMNDPGPRFLWARVSDGPPSAYKRDFDLALRRQIFRDAYLAKT